MLVDLDVILPVEADVFKGNLNKLFDRMRFARANNVIVRLILL